MSYMKRYLEDLEEAQEAQEALKQWSKRLPWSPDCPDGCYNITTDWKQIYKVAFFRKGHWWEGVITAPTSTSGGELEQMAQDRYGVVIDVGMASGFNPNQPGLIKMSGPPTMPPATAPTQGVKPKERVEGHYEDDDWDWDSDPTSLMPPETRVQNPKCEADKPEGTRDVDKYLKEQQDKLWGMGS